MYIIKKWLFITLLLLTLASTGVSQEQRERYVDEKGGFAFDLPKGWHLQDVPGAKYKVASGTRENGFTPNIYVEEDQCPCPLAEYVVLAQQLFESRYQEAGLDSFKPLGKTEFSTSSGRKGWKLTNGGTGRGLSVVFRQYIFEDEAKRQRIFTCGGLASATALESICDGSMKTVTFTR